MAACTNGVERWRDNAPKLRWVALTLTLQNGSATPTAEAASLRRTACQPCCGLHYTPKAALLDTKEICCARNHGSCDIF
jgi:hypothetical protein